MIVDEGRNAQRGDLAWSRRRFWLYYRPLASRTIEVQDNPHQASARIDRMTTDPTADEGQHVICAMLLAELLDGPSADAYMLNRGDVGLLRSLDRLSAPDASATTGGGASIAAHVDHLHYGLALLNRWSAGENPFKTADWGRSWERTTVSEPEWRELRAALTVEARRWLSAIEARREAPGDGMKVVIGSIAHLAYHLGAIRQIHRGARGPAEPGRVR
jgi:hypothetical protein